MKKKTCDTCYRRKQCNDEGRLITYLTLDDNYADHAYEKNGVKAAHGMLHIGEVCPLNRGELSHEQNQLH